MSFKSSSEESNVPFDWKKHMPLAPIIVTFIAIAAWLVFILLYALFWSTGFNWFQNVIVTIVSLVLVGLVIGLIWTVWGMKYAKSM
jgi:hypothetical protein